MRNPSSTAEMTSSSRGKKANTTPCCSKVGLKRGPWTAEEDEILVNYIKKEGEGRWRTLPKLAGLRRCGKSCRLRWMNYLRPSVKRGHIAPDEEDLILRLHRLLGNRWSLIAGRIPGRTDNEIKNYWNTHLSKKLMSQGIDPRTHKPLNVNNNNNKNETSSFAGAHHHLESSSPPMNAMVDGSDGTVNNENHNYVLGDDHDHQYNYHIQTDQTDDDVNYCNDDAFSSFVNSLINEDPFGNNTSQQVQQHDFADDIVGVGVSDDPMVIMSPSFEYNHGPEENRS